MEGSTLKMMNNRRVASVVLNEAPGRDNGW